MNVQRQPRRPLGALPGLEAGGADVLMDPTDAYRGDGLETVIDPDERVEITDPSASPFRRIARLEITTADGAQFLGTGWFIGPRTLITAGHCVYVHGHGPAKSVLVVPAQRDDNFMPFQQARSVQVFYRPEWERDALQPYDYGAIQIDKPLGDEVGWFGFGVYNDDELAAAPAQICGYPSDLPLVNGRPRGKSLFFHARKIKQVEEKIIRYDTDTYRGQSGSPVYLNIRGKRVAVGIHNNGIYGVQTLNSGTRITASVYDDFMSWRSQS